MKKLTTTAGVFGPYKVIETGADRYRVDGAELPFTVVGQGAIADVQPGDFIPVPLLPTREQIQADLAALDLKSIRSLREYIAAKPDAPTFVKQYETDAAALREKLK